MLAHGRRRLRRALERSRAIGALVEKHPLGFLRVNLKCDSRSGDECLIHVWDSAAEAPGREDPQPHNHVFDLKSCVLVGAIKNTEFAISLTADGDHRLATVMY